MTTSNMKITIGAVLVLSISMHVCWLSVGASADTSAQTGGPPPPATKPKEGSRVDMWITVPKVFDQANPVVRIEHKYIGSGKSVKLRLPNEREIGNFANIRVIVDGKATALVNPGIELGNPVFSRREELKPGKSIFLTVPLKKIFKIPARWKKLEIAPTRSEIPVWGFTGSLTIVDDRRLQDKSTTKAGTTTKTTATRPRDGARVDMGVTVPKVLDQTNPVVRIEYKYIGSGKPVKLRLPNEREISNFTNIRVNIDGKTAALVNPGIELGNPVFSRREELKPGKSIFLDVPLKKIFKIPAGWKKLEITPTRSEIPLLGLTCSLTITDDSALYPAVRKSRTSRKSTKPMEIK